MRPACTVDVTIRDIPDQAIANSAAIQFHEVLDTNRFLNPIRQGSSNKFDSITYYDCFVDMLSKMFGVSKNNVYVLSVQMSKPERPYPAIDVHFAIKKESTAKPSFLPRYVLINTLEKNKDTLKTIGKHGRERVGVSPGENTLLRLGLKFRQGRNVCDF